MGNYTYLKRPLIVHVDYGSRGNSGLYILSILDNLNIDVEVKGYVSAFFKYHSNKKVIKIFDNISSKISFRLFQRVIRYIELLFSFLRIFISCYLVNRQVFLFVSIYEPFVAYKWFFSLCKLSPNLKLTTIVHDADSLYNNYPSFIMCKQDEIIQIADYIIVHTDQSANKLKRFNKPIWKLPFPLMQLVKSNKLSIGQNKCIKFLFIGYLRKEKGIDILINAWKEIQSEFKNASLTIAGQIPFNLKYDFSGLNNFTIISEFLNDEQYTLLIEECNYVILPYTSGTNSGVLATVASLNKPIILSDIPMFKESVYSIPELFFTVASFNSLSMKLRDVILNHENKYHKFVNKIIDANEILRDNFSVELNIVHSSIINQNLNNAIK
jgi:glycosyltransferase involved in cell wall biosynthesis